MLLVDDEPLVRQVLARMLEESGFTVTRNPSEMGKLLKGLL